MEHIGEEVDVEARGQWLREHIAAQDADPGRKPAPRDPTRRDLVDRRLLKDRPAQVWMPGDDRAGVDPRPAGDVQELLVAMEAQAPGQRRSEEAASAVHRCRELG